MVSNKEKDIKTWLKIVFIGFAIAHSMISFAKDKLPSGWQKKGTNPEGYVVGIDKSIAYIGSQSAFLVSTTKPTQDKDNVLLTQVILLEAYKGKRIRFSAFIKGQDILGQSGLWLQTNSEDNKTVFAAVKTDNIPLVGTTDWTERSIEVDISEDGHFMYFGVYLEGAGKAWIDGISIDIVNDNAELANKN